MKISTKSQIETKYLILLLTLLLLGLGLMWTSAEAAVNVRMASYMRKEVDWISKDMRFQLSREYNSRHLHMGLFGFGWCSNLEVAIIPNPDGTLSIKSCLSHQDDIFRRRQPTIDGDAVYARPGTDEAIVAKDGQFFLHKGPDYIDQFDSRGRWIGRRTPSDNWFLEYNQADFPYKLIVNGQTLLFDPTFGSRRVKRISTSGAIFEIHYFYEDQDLSLIKAPGKSVSYKYDRFHNLTRLRVLGGESHDIEYDPTMDRVIRVRNGGCLENYNYVTRPERFRTEVLSQCQGRHPVKLNYQFEWRGQQVLLTTLKLESGESKLINSYDGAEQLTSTEFMFQQKSWRLKFGGAQRALQPNLNPTAMVSVLSSFHFGAGGPI